MSSDVGNRFARITADNHSGSIWIAALLCLIYSVLIIVLRGHLRWNMYGLDDLFAALATLLQAAEVVAIFVGLKHGLGQTVTILPMSERIKASQATFASLILFILAACLAKCSTLWLMMRLFNLTGQKTYRDRKTRLLWWICIVTLGVMVMWGVLSIVAISVDCSPLTFAQTSASAKCPNQFLRWQLIIAFDVITEAMLVLSSIAIVWPVQLSLQLKFQVILAFAFRLLVAVVAIIRLHYVSKYVNSDQPGLAIVPVLVCQQIEICWSLISSTIPNLKSFVKSFNSGFGLTIDHTATIRSNYGRYGAGYELGSVGNGNTHVSSRGGTSRLATMHGGADTVVSAARPSGERMAKLGNENGSITSVGSQEQIIRKDVRWDVQYEA